MCGRFELKADKEYLEKIFKKGKKRLKPEIDPTIVIKKENIAPTNKIFTVMYADNEYKLTLTKWGFKFSDKYPLIFNSRIETIKEKSFWKTLFTKSKCLIPMSAFYEWLKMGTKKIPQRIYLPEEELFFVPLSLFFQISENKNIRTNDTFLVWIYSIKQRMLLL